MGISAGLGTAGLQPAVCTSTTRPAAPYAGQMIFETDTNRLVLYNGSSWVYIADTDTPPGLELIKTQTVGTTVSSVTVSNCFSSGFDNYRITWTGGTVSTLAVVAVYMGSSAGTAYYGARTATNTSSAAALAADSNATRWNYAGVGNATWAVMSFDLFNPFQSLRTTIDATYLEGAGALGKYVGYLDNNTSYTDITFDPDSTATMTGGTIRVYGYRNSQ